MVQERRNLTVTWCDREGAGTNRVTVPLRWLQLGAGGVLLALLAAVVLSGVTLQLHQQSAALYARAALLERETEQLGQELGAARQEMELSQESLALVRAEGAKIRSWLGLEAPEGDPALPVVGVEGGKGSAEEEGLDTVAPEARATEAEAAAGQQRLGLLAEPRALAEDLAALALNVENRKEGWDAVPAISPVDGEHWISSGFGWRNSPFTPGKREFHKGLDLAGRKGTPVVATANGRVDRVFRDPALGHGVSIDHGNGIRTIYGHLATVSVKAGASVTRGQQVGTMGSTGKRSTGPHVHYALKIDNQYVNPRNYLLDRTRLGTQVAQR